MNIYRVLQKKKKDQPFWDDSTLLVLAQDFSDAENKVRSFGELGEIVEIKVNGETTYNKDIFRLRER